MSYAKLLKTLASLPEPRPIGLAGDKLQRMSGFVPGVFPVTRPQLPPNIALPQIPRTPNAVQALNPGYVLAFAEFITKDGADFHLRRRHAIILEMGHTAIAALAVMFYLGSAIVIGLRLFWRDGVWEPYRWVGILLGFVGIVLHATLLYLDIFTASGLNLGFFIAASLVAWTVALLLLISSVGNPVENLGIAVLPLAAICIVLEINYPSARLLDENATYGLKLHILISVIAYGLLTLASIQSVLLSIQDHHLHGRRPGGFIRALPPLQTMETLLFELIGVGFFLLSLSLVSGFMFLEDMFAQRLVHKTVLSIAAWLVFGTLLWGRFRFGWRGRTAIIWTLSGFVVLMLAYFGSKAVIELILGNAAG